MLNAALDDGIILANPGQGLGRKLRLTKTATTRQEQIKAFDRAQVSRFLGATIKVVPRLYPLVLTMARTGLDAASCSAMPGGTVWAFGAGVQRCSEKPPSRWTPNTSRRWHTLGRPTEHA
jgi:hypothetical protein